MLASLGIEELPVIRTGTFVVVGSASAAFPASPITDPALLDAWMTRRRDWRKDVNSLAGVEDATMDGRDITLTKKKVGSGWMLIDSVAGDGRINDASCFRLCTTGDDVEERLKALTGGDLCPVPRLPRRVGAIRERDGGVFVCCGPDTPA